MTKTPEQILQDLKDLGVDLGAWGIADGGSTVLPSVIRQRLALLKLQKALEQMAEKDFLALTQLHEQLQRLEHGGGS